MTDEQRHENPGNPELIRKAEELLHRIKLIKARGEEPPPVRWLEPEAHEDAVHATKPLWIEGMKILGEFPKCQIETPDHKRWNLYKGVTKGDVELGDFELLISSPTDRQIEKVGEEKIEYRTSKGYWITTKGVVLSESHTARTIPENPYPWGFEEKRDRGERRQPKGLTWQRTEVGRDEINEVLQVIQSRIAIYPNHG